MDKAKVGIIKSSPSSSGSFDYGSFSTTAQSGASWISQQVNTPTKALIDHDLLYSHNEFAPNAYDHLSGAPDKSKKLVIKFDANGFMTYDEMTRHDVMMWVQSHIPAIRRNSKSENSGLIGIGSPRVRNIKKRPGNMFIQSCGSNDVQPLHMRDLRKLDDSFHATNEPSMIVRKQVILISTDLIRGVILRNCCLMFIPSGADSLIAMLRDKMSRSKAEEGDIPYEFRALEAFFCTLCKLLGTDYERLETTATDALLRLNSPQLSSGEIEVLSILKNKIHEFESQISGIRRILMELLDNEESLRFLYLTKLHEKPALLQEIYAMDSEEAEVLIEAYLQDIHSIRAKVALMENRILNTENVVMLKMDSVRNSLLWLETIFGLIMLCMNFTMFVSSALGMNLVSGYETKPYLFWVVLLTSTFFTLLGIYLGLRFFARKGIILMQ